MSVLPPWIHYKSFLTEHNLIPHYKYFTTNHLPYFKTLDHLLTVVTEMPKSEAIALWVLHALSSLNSAILSHSSTISEGVNRSSITPHNSDCLTDQITDATSDKDSLNNIPMYYYTKTGIKYWKHHRLQVFFWRKEKTLCVKSVFYLLLFIFLVLALLYGYLNLFFFYCFLHLFLLFYFLFYFLFFLGCTIEVLNYMVHNSVNQLTSSIISVPLG